MQYSFLSHTFTHDYIYIYRCHDFHLQACRTDRRSLSITVAMAMKQLVQQTLAVWHTPHSCRIKSPWQFFNFFRSVSWVVSTYPCRPWFLGVVMCIAGTLGLLRLLGQTPRWTKLGMVILKPGKMGEGVAAWVDAFMRRCECLCRYSFKGSFTFYCPIFKLTTIDYKFEDLLSFDTFFFIIFPPLFLGARAPLGSDA